MRCGGQRRGGLTTSIILGVLKAQEYKCALTGVAMTCKLVIGVDHMTNASVDRIIAGGPYTEDNIQMVCRGVNMWRGVLPVAEYVDWCRKVAAHHDTRTLSVAQGEKEYDHG